MNLERLQRAWAQPETRWLAAILVLAAVLRIVWVLYAAREPQGIHDPVFYFGYADSIAELGLLDGYQLPAVEPIGAGHTAYYPIGYPAVLGGLNSLLRHTFLPDNLALAVGFFQVVLGVATVALVYHLGRRLFSPLVGLVAALWLAVFPNIIFHTATFLTETLFMFLVMSALAVIISAGWRDQRLSWQRICAFAVLLALSALVRPISLLLLPLLAVAWLAGGFGMRRTLQYAAGAAVVVAVVLTPWAVRNAVVMRAPIVISANIGDNLCIGHHAGASGAFALPEECFPDASEYAGLDRAEFEVRRNNDNIRTALTYAFKHPLKEVELVFRKAWWLTRQDHDGLWAIESYGDDPFIDADLRTGLGRLADVFFFATVAVGALGLFGLARPFEARRLFFLLALLGLALVPLVFFGDARFHVPAMPLLVIPAAWMVVTLPGVLQRLGAPPGTDTSGGLDEASAEEVVEGGASVADHDTL